MRDADPRLSKILLAYAALGAASNLVGAARRGPRRAAGLFVLGVGLPAAGEILATGPLRLLRHRTRPRVAGVPVAILLGWYCAINGSLAVAKNTLEVLPLGESTRKKLLPVSAALVGTSLDLILDPAGLDAGLWEWTGEGAYAGEITGANGRRGVPLVNFAGWLLLVAGVVSIYGRLFGERRTSGRFPALLLLPYYLAAVNWAARRSKYRYLLYSVAFPIAFTLSLKQPGR